MCPPSLRRAVSRGTHLRSGAPGGPILPAGTPLALRSCFICIAARPDWPGNLPSRDRSLIKADVRPNSQITKLDPPTQPPTHTHRPPSPRWHWRGVWDRRSPACLLRGAKEEAGGVPTGRGRGGEVAGTSRGFQTRGGGGNTTTSRAKRAGCLGNSRHPGHSSHATGRILKAPVPAPLSPPTAPASAPVPLLPPPSP